MEVPVEVPVEVTAAYPRGLSANRLEKATFPSPDRGVW